MNKFRKDIRLGTILFALFIVLLLLVKFVNVKPIGPEASKIGLSSINGWFFTTFGESTFWYNVTKYIFVIPILTVAGFALMGIMQFVQRKSLAKVDKTIVLLGFFYVAMVIVYALFEIITINYRPVLDEGVLKASFPSTHTMIVTCVMGSAMVQFKNRIKDNKIRIAFNVISVLVIVLTAIGRLLAGVHWFTDVLGGLLVGCVLVMLYKAFCDYIYFQKRTKLSKNRIR